MKPDAALFPVTRVRLVPEVTEAKRQSMMRFTVSGLRMKRLPWRSLLARLWPEEEFLRYEACGIECGGRPAVYLFLHRCERRYGHLRGR